MTHRRRNDEEIGPCYRKSELGLLVDNLLKSVLSPDDYWKRLGHSVKIYQTVAVEGGGTVGRTVDFGSEVSNDVLHWDSGETFSISDDGLYLVMETWVVEDGRVENDVYCDFSRGTREEPWELELFAKPDRMESNDGNADPLSFIRDYLSDVQAESRYEDDYWDRREEFDLDPEGPGAHRYVSA